MAQVSDHLKRLQEGNRRYASGGERDESRCSPERREELVEGQEPFAIILGCADSRVPPEVIFDQGLGDLFVVRVAGNTAGPAEIGSIEYAVANLGTRLIVVLGHTRCGAVAATISELVDGARVDSPNLREVVDRIQPVVKPLVKSGGAQDPKALMAEAIRANVHATVELLQCKSEILKGLIDRGELRVVGAEYSLETGVVEFF